MYGLISDDQDVQIGTYPDLWRKGHYRVDLYAELPFDADSVDAALQQLGYHITDTGQCGQSYSHNKYRSHTAELDEAPEQAGYVGLVLRSNGLNEADTEAAENDLSSVYERIRQICDSCCKEYDYESLIRSSFPDGVQEPAFLLSHYEIRNLTYGLV